MISSDCHGKDSWKHGNFGDNVLQLKLMRADGTIATLDRDDELMKAVIAGLGMLGIVTEIKLKLRRIPSLIVSASQYKTDIKALPEHDNIKTEYQYAWLDMLNRNPCAIVRTASFDISKAHQTIDEAGFPKIKSTVRGLPPKTFWKLLGLFWNPRSYKVFNSFLRAIHRERKTQNQFILDYLYPWRKYPSNKYLFKKDSFYELQVIFSQKKFVIAFEEIRALTKSYGIYPLSSVIKWHRRDDVLLSFSGDGLSIANTFEAALVNSAKGKDFLSKYTELCIGLEGKFYLSKYPYLNREQLQTSFVGFERWHRLKQETDPKNIFLSNTASKWILV
jgi:FAD/FMN-containing dehydrogenase